MKKRQSYWHLKADKGDIVADAGEGYDRVEGCYHGIGLTKGSAEAAVRNLVTDEVLVLFPKKDSQVWVS